MKNSLSAFILIIALSVSLILIININLYLYVVFRFLVMTIVQINLSISINIKFYTKILLFDLFILCSIIFERYLVNKSEINIVDFILILFTFLHIYIMGIWLYESKNENRSSINKVNLKISSKRKQDLDQLEYYLSKFDIVGLNAPWGTGKSFLVECFKNNNKNEYEYVEVDLLTSNLNEVQLTLIESIEEVLLKNRILPKYTNNLKKNLTSLSFLGKIQSFLTLALNSSELKSGVFKNFIEETKKLKRKKILIIFEDIDRVENKESIKEIFAISEKIANHQIKILYQYDEDLLVETGFSFEYLEKYIPFKINLTKLHISEVIKSIVDDKLIENTINLSDEDFTYLHQLSEFRFRAPLEILNINIDTNEVFDYLPFRKLENMILEISYTLSKNLDIQRHKELIISFYVLKHLLPDQFTKLRNNVNADLFATFNFKTSDNEKYSILELIKEQREDAGLNQDRLIDIFSNHDNSFYYDNNMNYFVLKLFNYNIINEQSLSTERFRTLKKIEKNNHDKNNRLIQKMLYEGNSNLTDYEFAKREFIEKVLNEEYNQQDKYKEYLNYFFLVNRHEIGNSTIFRIGDNYMESIFKSFNLSHASGEEFIELLNFYLNHHNEEKVINISLLKCLNQINLNSIEEIFNIMNIFNDLNVRSNYNGKIEFFNFLNKMFEEILSNGILESDYLIHCYELTQSECEIDSSEITNCLSEAIEEANILNEELTTLNLYPILSILNATIEFLEKIITIINYPQAIEESNEPRVNTSITTKFRNQEHYDEIIAMFRNGVELDDLKIAISKKFEAGELSISEIRNLMQNVAD